MNDNNSTPPHVQAIQVLRNETSSNTDKLKAGSFLIQNNHYDYYIEVIETLEPFESEFTAHIEWHYCMGFGKVTQHQPEESIPHLLKTLSLINNNSSVYTALTWAYLQTNNWAQAFLTSSAGLQNTEQKGGLEGLNYLSKILFQGHRSVSFNKEGIDYQFALFSTNTQEIEAALHHISQQFTEFDELKMIQKHFGTIESIAEIGCLVGNHSVYFLKNFSPKRLSIIDASQTSLQHAKTNVELNNEAKHSTQVDFIHTAIGLEKGTIKFFENEVEVNPIDELLTQPYEFLKIDVDGMEMDALNGAKNYIHTHQPKMMIEVLHVLKAEFMNYLENVNYEVIDQIDHQDYSNYLVQLK